MVHEIIRKSMISQYLIHLPHGWDILLALCRHIRQLEWQLDRGQTARHAIVLTNQLEYNLL